MNLEGGLVHGRWCAQNTRGQTEQPLTWLFNKAEFKKCTIIVFSSGIVLILKDS